MTGWSPRRPQSSGHHRKALSLLVLGLFVSACSSTHGSNLSAQSPGAAVEPTGPAPSSTGPSSSPTPAAVTGSAAGAVGQELNATHVDALAQCGMLVTGVPAVPTQQLATGGLDVLSCSAATFTAGQPAVSVVDVTRGKLLWHAALPPTAQLLVGTSHLFYVTSTVLPAGPLTSSSTIYGLSAVDITTGKQAWSVPLSVPAGLASVANYLTLTEAPSGIDGHPEGVLVQIQQQWTMFDADSGQQLFSHGRMDPLETGTYEGWGVVVTNGYQDNDGSGHHTGFSVQSGAQLWDVRTPTLEKQNIDSVTVDSSGNLWFFGGGGFAAIALQTGTMVAQGAVTGEGFDYETYAPGLMAISSATAGTIRLFNLKNPGQAVWTIQGTGNPVVVTDDSVVAVGPLGLVLLSSKDGSILTTLDGAGFGDGGIGNGTALPTVVDGLVPLGDGSVLRVGRPG